MAQARRVLSGGVRIDVEDLIFDSEKRALMGFSDLFSGDFPASFQVYSQRTRRTVTFQRLISDGDTAAAGAIYAPTVDLPRVAYLILQHTDNDI